MKMPSFASTAVLVTSLTLLSVTSCTYDPYTSDPEGVTYSAVPAGYTVLVIGGISYWHYNNHYCRYWPGRGYVVVRPPYGRPPYGRPPAYRPPGARPPGTNPPGVKPPGTKPPGVKPPGITPATKPATTRPGVSTRPATTPTTRGGSRGSAAGGMSRGSRGGGRR